MESAVATEYLPSSQAGLRASNSTTGAASHRGPRRLSREESQKQTRGRLITVGREHFLAFGLGGAKVDKIAEEAGYSRGALYANFDGKEDLFVAVMQEQHERYRERYESIFRENADPDVLLKKLRSTFIEMVLNPEWVVLWAEFQSEAVRNEEMRAKYEQFYNASAKTAVGWIADQEARGVVLCSLSPSDFVLSMSSLSHGLAIRQRILRDPESKAATRKIIGKMFDALIRTRE
jgi:AcrR family transcriptional regulator